MIGTVLHDRYRLLAEIGQGGMGVVYRAHDPRLDREVALKMIAPQVLGERARQRFEHEARVVAQMDHPGIVPIHDFGRVDGSLFLVMPLLGGRNLRQRIGDGDLNQGEVLDVAIQVAEALDHSHNRGVVHRDVKPENIMVELEGGRLRARIMDFGLARDTADARDSRSGVRGTIAYLSPEQVEGRAVDARTDVWALGVVIWECLAGAPPFAGPGPSVFVRILAHDPDPTRLDTDEEVRRVLMRCLAKEPAERFQSGRDLASTLLGCWSSLPRRSRTRTLLTTREAASPLPPLVGRDRELQEVERRIDTALSGRCQVVLLGGEPGTGKSRLLAEIERRTAAQGFRVLRGQFAGPDDAFPYQGYAEAIQSWFAGAAHTASQTLPELGDLAADLLAILPSLADVEPIRVAAADAPSAAPGRSLTGPTAVFELLARTFHRLAGGRPLALLMESIHRGDVSVEALQYVARRLGSTPTLIAASYRSTEVTPGDPTDRLRRGFRDDARFVELFLGPLRLPAVRTLLELHLGSRDIEQDLVERFARASGGNPSFCRELLNSLREAGSIARTEHGSWGLTADAALSADAMPATVQQAIERRIERLEGSDRQLLEVAAVLGSSFEFPALRELGPEDLDVDAAVDRLLAGGFLVEESDRPREDLLAFASTMVRDHLVRDLSRRRRRAIHRRYAELLERRHADQPERALPQLVHHFGEADVPGKTVRYALDLARASIRSRSPDDALRAARIALELADEPEARPLGPLEAELRELLAAAHRQAGSYESSLREAERAFAVVDRAGDDARRAERIVLDAAETAWQARRIEDLESWIATGLREDRDLSPEGRHRLLTLGATLATLSGDHPRARLLLDRAEQVLPRPVPPEAVAPRGGTLRLVLPSPVHNLRPGELRTAEEMEVAATVFETLLGSDPDGNLHGVLCHRWEMHEDGRLFVFDLAEGLRFSNGDRLTAVEVKRSLEASAHRVAARRISALGVLQGAADFLAGEAPGIRGLRVDPERPSRLEVRLDEPLPIFPAFLTDPNTAIAHEPVADAAAGEVAEGGGAGPYGTGPFRLAGTEAGPGVTLERNPCFRTPGRPLVDRIRFRADRDAASIATGLEQGELDLGRDLSPGDVEEVLRDPRFQRNLVQTTRRNVYFVLFHVGSPGLSSPAVREAMIRSIGVRDLVWRTLGRFAHPAVCLIPPGILGHEAGRRLHPIDRDSALGLLSEVGGPRPVQLRAAVHPVMLDRYGALTRAVLRQWRELGIEVEVASRTVEELLEAQEENAGLDLWIGRWNADYDDPDDFSFRLFHSRGGIFRRWFASPDCDRVLERARRESRPSVRQALYRRFEEQLADGQTVLPLFHDVDYRIAGPRVRGLAMKPSPPWVDYAGIGVLDDLEADAVRPPAVTRSTLTVPIPIRLDSLDPAGGNILELCEVTPNVFETLARLEDGGRVVPWLAASIRPEDGGRSYRVRLRPDARFHDGRRVTGRDVRWSFERLLQAPARDLHFLLLPLAGAAELQAGRASGLRGVRILSATELVLELEEPLAFFPTLLTHPATGILPEGARFDEPSLAGADRWIGSGPFRVRSFDPGRRIELDRSATWWGEGRPGVDRLVFELGQDPLQVLEGFRRGRFSLASDLRPEDAEALRRDPAFSAGYREAPRLSTYYLALNSRTGFFADPARRRALVAALDPDRLVGDDLGPTALRASSLIPPGLAGHEPGPRPSPASGEPDPGGLGADGVVLRVAALPIYTGTYARLWDRTLSELDRLGFRIDLVCEGPTAEVIRLAREGEVDLLAHRWVADYPDADSFVTSLVHSREGLLQGLVRIPEVDRLAEAGRRETDPVRRDAIYRGVEEQLRAEAVLAPLFHEQTYRFAHPWVEGLRLIIGTPEVAYDELRLGGAR